MNRLPRISTYFRTGGSERRRSWTARGTATTWREPDTLAGFMTPARIPYQNDLIEEVVRREGFGADDVPDLLYINYKLTDEIGHTDSMNSVEMRDAVRATDEGLRELVGILDAAVGEGEWVMAVTADHGHTPDPDVSGAYVISPTAAADVMQRRVRPGRRRRARRRVHAADRDVHRPDELAEQGYTLNDVSAFLMEVTFRDVGSPTWPVPAGGPGRTGVHGGVPLAPAGHAQLRPARRVRLSQRARTRW